MRTAFSLALALLLAAPAAQAQVSLGLRAGLNVADWSGSDASEEGSPTLGFVGGAFAEFPVTPMFSVQPEVLFSQKGSEGETPLGQQLDVSVNYLEVPLLLALNYPLQSGLELGAYVGPYAAFKLSESFEVDDEELESEFDLVESTDLGIAVGATVGSGPFGVDLRYTRGLTNLASDEFIDGSGNRADLVNSVFAVTGFYKFMLGR